MRAQIGIEVTTRVWELNHGANAWFRVLCRWTRISSHFRSFELFFTLVFLLKWSKVVWYKNSPTETWALRVPSSGVEAVTLTAMVKLGQVAVRWLYHVRVGRRDVSPGRSFRYYVTTHRTCYLVAGHEDTYRRKTIWIFGKNFAFPSFFTLLFPFFPRIFAVIGGFDLNV